MDVDSSGPPNGKSQATNSKKRSAPFPDIDEDEDDEQAVDKLLPAATAIKRRRIEEAEYAERNGVSSERSFETSHEKPEKGKSRKPKKEVNIKDVVRERREAEEEAAKRDEENLRDTLDGMNVEEMKNLAVIEEMELPSRPQQPQQNGQNSSRWDERWNGRKNFKKFRRRGEGTVARRGATVIVPLEEAKKKDHGIGEDYWLESEKTKRKRKEKERATQSQSQPQSQPFTTARSQAVEVPAELAVDGGDLPDTIDVDAPRTTRHQEQTQQSDDTPSTGRFPAVNRKRPAANQANGNAAKKKMKFAVQDSDSDSEDELKFRFGRRR